MAFPFRRIYMGYNETPTKGNIMKLTLKNVFVALCVGAIAGSTYTFVKVLREEREKVEQELSDAEIDMLAIHRALDRISRRVVSGEKFEYAADVKNALFDEYQAQMKAERLKF